MSDVTQANGWPIIRKERLTKKKFIIRKRRGKGNEGGGEEVRRRGREKGGAGDRPSIWRKKKELASATATEKKQTNSRFGENGLGLQL